MESTLLAPPPELLRSLGRLWRGLTMLFWSIPLTLIIFGLLWIQTVNAAPAATPLAAWLESLNVFPPLLATALLLSGLSQLGGFQKQERVWQTTLDRAKVSAWLNLGLSPFLFWWSAIPSSSYFSLAARLLMISSLLFLAFLNRVLDRLAAMLPDETLRADTRFFTRVNVALISGMLALAIFSFALFSARRVPHAIMIWMALFDQIRAWTFLIFLLVPVALTMTLIWKIKELILASVFNEATQS